MCLTLGLHLVREGYVTPERLIAALDWQEQRRPRIGQLALRARKMTVRQVLDVLARQSEQREPFGQRALRLGYLTQMDLDLLLIEQQRQTPRVGDILLMQGAVDADTLQVQTARMVRAGVADDQLAL